MTTDVVVPAYVPLRAAGGYRRVLAALQATARRALQFRLRCLILGHEDSFGREPRRLILRCTACGRETVGWPIGRGAPAVMATPQPSPVRRAAPLETAVRVGPWTLQRQGGRPGARERQRQRLVVAASRAGRGGSS